MSCNHVRTEYDASDCTYCLTEAERTALLLAEAQKGWDAAERQRVTARAAALEEAAKEVIKYCSCAISCQCHVTQAAIRSLGTLPPTCGVFELTAIRKAREALEYVQRYGMEDDGSSHSIEAQVSEAIAAISGSEGK